MERRTATSVAPNVNRRDVALRWRRGQRMAGVLLTGAVIAAGAGAGAGGSWAGATSCVQSGVPSVNPYELRAVVFVGTVTATSYGNSLARVTVEEVWRGPALPPEVEVLGSDIALTPVPPGLATPGVEYQSSSDHYYQLRQRYLFAPSSGPVAVDGGPMRFEDFDYCSFLTRAHTPELDALRPGAGGDWRKALLVPPATGEDTVAEPNALRQPDTSARGLAPAGAAGAAGVLAVLSGAVLVGRSVLRRRGGS